MNTNAAASRADVVLGDDWVRPDSAVEHEVLERRASRRVFSIYRSPLARKIITFNLVALLLLVAGVLFTNPFRDSLMRQQEELLIVTASVVADTLAGQGPLDQVGPSLVDRLTLDRQTEVVLLAGDGSVIARKRGTAERANRQPVDPERRTVISDFLTAVWSGLSFVTGSHLIERALPDFGTVAGQLHAQALQGVPASHSRRDSAEDVWFAVAAPVHSAHDADMPVEAVLLLRRDAADVALAMRHEREQVLQMFLIALLVSVGLSFALASTIANPLADLAMAAELGRNRDARRVSPGRVRIPDLTGRPDEIGRLSKAMRGMVSALYDRIEANEQFAADVAHEIKNPLASLRSAVGTLRVARRPDQVQRLLDVIEHDVRRLDRLISDTSNASRLDSELVKEQEETFDLRKTLDNLNEHLSQEAADKGVEFIRALPASRS